MGTEVGKGIEAIRRLDARTESMRKELGLEEEKFTNAQSAMARAAAAGEDDTGALEKSARHHARAEVLRGALEALERERASLITGLAARRATDIESEISQLRHEIALFHKQSEPLFRKLSELMKTPVNIDDFDPRTYVRSHVNQLEVQIQRLQLELNTVQINPGAYGRDLLNAAG